MLAFERQAARDRAAEIAAGGQEIVALEQALAAERLNIQLQFAQQSVTAAQQAVDAAQQALDRTMAAERQAYEDQASVMRETVSRLQSFIKGIQDFKRSLVLDDALSPFSPAQRLAEAQRQYQDIATRALGGDLDALGKLEGVSRDYLSEARDYYASSEAYYTAFSDVQRILDQTSATARYQLSEAERQLEAMDAQISALTKIDDSVLSVELAVRELALAQGVLAEAMRAQSELKTSSNESMLRQAYLDVFGRQADAQGMAYWLNEMNAGRDTIAEIYEHFNAAKALGAYRMGGMSRSPRRPWKAVGGL